MHLINIHVPNACIYVQYYVSPFLTPQRSQPAIISMTHDTTQDLLAYHF